MANSVAKDVAILLDANLFGVLGTNLFAMAWGDDSTDAQTIVLDTGGIDTANKDQYEQPTFQILSRGAKQGSGSDVYDTLRSIHVFLMQQPSLITISGTDYLGFWPVSAIAGLGRDDNGRFIYSMNYFTFRNSD